MDNKRFCELETGFTGEKIDNIKQLTQATFTGEELKEYVEFFIEQENKDVYECLIDMCVQYLGDMDGEWLYHECMSAGENALDLLKRAGLAESKDDCNYKIIESKQA